MVCSFAMSFSGSSHICQLLQIHWETQHGESVWIRLGSFTVPSQRMNISEFVKKAYLAYFKLKIGDQGKSWAPHSTCKPCVENLRHCTKGTRKQLSFVIPMVWEKLSYPNLDSAIRSVSYSHEIPVAVFTELPSLEDEDDICKSGENLRHASDTDFVKTLMI